MTKEVDVDQLMVFSPLDGLKKDNLHALSKKTKLREAEAGQTLFKEADAEKLTVYIVSGSVELRDDGEVIDTITGGTEGARAEGLARSRGR